MTNIVQYRIQFECLGAPALATRMTASVNEISGSLPLHLVDPSDRELQVVPGVWRYRSRDPRSRVATYTRPATEHERVLANSSF
ncbi:hypothetical protein GCM10027413_18880 [Conyzicola nivalis]|uniref:Uncharacterized protein n=1 Tax=Conyzicola nivalis TaxID=1477021 RepID=A0A916WG09_9MICO|nr:hypothetical protein [Conyzicola nivalis]GGA95747.1 hypothetical protein GCM10010979_07740 [Conyzicola nivalis]